MADTSAASDSAAAAAEAAPAPAPAVAVAADDAAATTEGTTAAATTATTTATTESATAAPSDAAAADTAAPEQAATGAGGGAGAGAAPAAGGEEGDAGTTSVEDVDVDMTPEVDEEKLKSLFGEHALRLPLNANSAPKGDLAVQDLTTMDVAKLTPLTPEIISRQATINIGTIGHVAHGKSTVVKAISGVQTVRFKNELVRNITIKLGYANAKIYRSSEKPYEYRATNSAVIDEFPIADDEAGRTWQLVRHVSFVDCPGHDILMATMLNGAAVMDAALLLVAGNEPCPQAQTSEHLAAVEIMQLSNIIILQNKIDLVKPEDAIAQRQQIKDFVAGTVAGNAPILPISAQLQYNVDVLAKYIVTHVPVPRRNFTAPPRLIVIRSFDVNKPGEDACNLKGGVAGGSILEGVLRVGDEIEVRPGKAVKDSAGKVTQCVPIYSRIVSLFAEKNGLQIAVPGGLIGVGTKMDPTLTRADRLVGQVLGIRGKLPDVFSEIEVKFHLLRRLLGVKTTGGEKQAKVQRLSKGEILMVNIGSTSSGGRVLNVKNDQAKIVLNSPVCTSENEKIALSRRVDKHWRLIGWGKIRRGVKIAVAAPSEAGAPALATDDE